MSHLPLIVCLTAGRVAVLAVSSHGSVERTVDKNAAVKANKSSRAGLLTRE